MSRWWSPFDGIEEMSFKRVPEGWVYAAPKPWVFGSGRYYLLSESQKAEIASQLRRVWRVLLAAIIVVVAVAVPISLPRFDEHPVAGLALAMLAGLVIGLLSNTYLCRAIRPIVAGLQPTTQRITQGEVLKTQVAVFSRGKLMFFGLLSLAMFALASFRPLLTEVAWDATSIWGAFLFGACTIYWFALYVAKRRQADRAAQ
jgi:hypothetical protein